MIQQLFYPFFHKRLPLVLLLILAVFQLAAQQRTISGTVQDEEGLALPGVSVLIKGTQKGTVTDDQGQFSIQAEQGQTLLFSFIGFGTREIKIGDQSRLKVELKEEIQEFADVVVIGYGTQKKGNVTGSI